MSKPVVAIVGRPNVGKSTLFNRLLGKPLAIVSETPGTTRDRVALNIPWKNQSMLLVDTGGIEAIPTSDIWEKVRAQIETAIQEADAVIFLVDIMEGITPSDRDIAQTLRQKKKSIILAANKVDNVKREEVLAEFYQLGLGDPMPISAYHNLGIRDLLSKLDDILGDPIDAEDVEGQIRLAIVGRPNVGKSMLVNSIVGNERSIVSDTPGTTRDAIDVSFSYDETNITLVDTAGVRRRGRIDAGIEKYSVLRSMRNIGSSDVCILVTDVSELVTSQDTHIAGYILDSFKGVIVVINKWDLAEHNLDKETLIQQVQSRLKFIPYAPICFTSALHGTGVQNVVETAITVYNEGKKLTPRGELERTLQNALSLHMPPSSKGLKIYRIYQKSTNPPTFVIFVNNPNLVHFSYKRYIENQIRLEFGFMGNPIHLIFSRRGRR
tara:strand:+ start:4370 stop:5680 length:1311 start_codon:yes stop_codon:yes gene_type:complete